jgi:hypothetical protein
LLVGVGEVVGRVEGLLAVEQPEGEARVEMSALRGRRVMSGSLQARTAPVVPSTTRLVSSMR